MRLWSLHPKYLDNIGLLALWRESLLARKVLLGKTKGYKNHPQLIRFRNSEFPIEFIEKYLYTIYIESENRGFNFDESKLNRSIKFDQKIKVNSEQIQYEFNHLLGKLKFRDRKKYDLLKETSNIEVNNIFEIVEGQIEEWEKVKYLNS